MKSLRPLWLPLMCAALLAACGSEEEGRKPLSYYQAFPSYVSVVKQFFRSHPDLYAEKFEEASGTRFTLEWNFEKRPDGWWVSEVENRPNEFKTLRSHHIWDANTKDWLKTEIADKPNADTAASFRRFFIPQEVHHYTVYPFYGYANWAGDCIENISADSALGDTLLYGMGRAYAVKSLAAIGVRTDPFTKINDAFDESFNPAVMSESQVQESVNQAKESLRLLEMVQKRNPGFVALVAPIAEKIAKDRMLFFQQFSLIGREKEARSFLAEGVLTPFQEEFVRNLMGSAAANAILIFESEDEAWPYLWAQQKLNLRPDLSILCMPTLAQPRYQHYHSQLVPQAQRVAFTIPPAVWKTGAHITAAEESNKTEAEIRAVLNEFAKGGGEWVKKGADNHLGASMATLKWQLNAEAARKAFPSLQADKEWEFPPYQMGITVLPLVDLVVTNNWTRPVEVPLNAGLRFYGPLAPHFYPKGFTAQLLPLSHPLADVAHGRMNQPLIDSLRKNLNERYTYKTVPDTLNRSAFDWLAVSVCRMAHAELAAPFGKLDRSPESVKIVRQCLERIPPQMQPLSLNDFWMVMVPAMNNDKVLAAQTIRAMKRGIITNPQTKKPEPLFGDRLQYFEFLIQAAKNINDLPLVKELELTLQAMQQK